MTYTPLALGASFLSLCAALLSPAHAAAEDGTVYRCTSSEGIVQYQALPCEGGQRLNAADPRDAQQQRESVKHAQDQARAAQNLNTQDRRPSAAPANATVIGKRASLDEPHSAADAKQPRHRQRARIVRGKTVTQKPQKEAARDSTAPLPTPRR